MKPVELINILGNPFHSNGQASFSDAELLSVYEPAFENRVGLLYLEKYRRANWPASLEEKFSHLKERETRTRQVITRLAHKLNQFDPDNYIIFKSIKPYPATPNDTDVIYLGSKKRYAEMVDYLLSDGYGFHEWAPQQQTLYDSEGKDQIGAGKKGGTYYIDLYEDISTDYYAYMNRHVLREYMIRRTIDGVTVNLLSPEPELAIIMFHNVFPERTFQLEHLYLPLYYLNSTDFRLDVFVNFVRRNKLEFAIKSNFSLIEFLCGRFFDEVPAPVGAVLNQLGRNRAEVSRFEASDLKLPYMFSQRTFWRTFLRKSCDLYSLRSLFVQGLKMLNPVFFWDVLKSLRARLSEKGVYHAE